MKLRCRCRGLVLACASGVLGAAQAATAPAEPAEPPGYVDRVIENLPPDTADEDSGYTYDREGMPRFLRLETRLGTQPFDARRQVRLGVAVYGLLETPNHGALSIDGQFTPADKSGTFTLRQRGLPLVGGWLANHELGFINSLTRGRIIILATVDARDSICREIAMMPSRLSPGVKARSKRLRAELF